MLDMLGRNNAERSFGVEANGTPVVPDPRVPDHEALLDGLSEPQRRAVTSEAAPLCVLAGAGAGKTRVLTRRIAWRVAVGSADPSRILALTFTRKAAGELGGRLRDLGLHDQVRAGTFHAVAAAQLRRWWADRGQRPPVLLDRKSRLLAPIVAGRPGLVGVALADVAGHIEWAKARLIAPARLEAAFAAAGRRPALPVAELAAVYARYEHDKTRRGLLDFDDLLARCADAMDADPLFAAAQRWRWRHLLVDEYQDLNPLQDRLLRTWLGPSVDLCVVGDPNQAIYGWNGADPGLLDAVTERWPSTEVVRLDVNHRSSPQIVRAAAALLGPAGTDLCASADDGDPVEVRAWESAEAEAHGVAAAVRRAHARDAGRWGDFAVLSRTNAQASVLADALRTASIPVRTPGAELLLDHPDVRAALAELGRSPGRPLATAAADLREWPDDHDGAVAALGDLARRAEGEDPTATVGSWLAWLPAELGRGREAAEPDRDAVTVCSFHRAKGLEWPEVWVCGLEDGLVPIGHATTPGAQAEELRLLYVALTRAGRRLHCSWARTRSFGARGVPRLPSPWLELIASSGHGPLTSSGHSPDEDAGPPSGEPPDAATWAARLIDQRDRLRAKARRRSRLPAGWPDPDDDVLERLRQWRADVARASAVPAHAVLHDTVIEALASLRPADRSGLLTVPGLGPLKADRFGPALLAAVAQRAKSA